MKRIIGAGTASLKGKPTELLERSMRAPLSSFGKCARQCLRTSRVARISTRSELSMSQLDEQRLLDTRGAISNATELRAPDQSFAWCDAEEGSRAHEELPRYVGDGIDQAWSNHWLPQMKTLGNLVAKVLGVDPGTVIMNQNVSTVQAVVASCFDWSQKRNKVVYSELEFSTVHYVWQAQARRGARVIIWKSDDGMTPPSRTAFRRYRRRNAICPAQPCAFSFEHAARPEGDS